MGLHYMCVNKNMSQPVLVFHVPGFVGKIGPVRTMIAASKRGLHRFPLSSLWDYRSHFQLLHSTLQTKAKPSKYLHTHTGSTPPKESGWVCSGLFRLTAHGWSCLLKFDVYYMFGSHCTHLQIWAKVTKTGWVNLHYTTWIRICSWGTYCWFRKNALMNGAQHTHTHAPNLSVTVNTDLAQSLMISIVH